MSDYSPKVVEAANELEAVVEKISALPREDKGQVLKCFADLNIGDEETAEIKKIDLPGFPMTGKVLEMVSDAGLGVAFAALGKIWNRIVGPPPA